MNYKKIKSYNKFIKIMNLLDDKEKLALLYDYFYHNVDYNYIEWLFNSMLNNSFFKDPIYKEYYGELNPKGSIMTLCSLGKITIWDEALVEKGFTEVPYIIEISELQDKYDLNKKSDVEEYKQAVIDIVKKRYLDNVKNKKLREEFSKTLISIMNNSFVPIKDKNDIEEYLYDVPWTLYLAYNKLSKTKYHKGLIREGVCRHFSAFIKKVLDDSDIYTVDVTGKSKSSHAWNMININGEIKFIDITREIYLRDGTAKDSGYNFNKGDWFLVDIDKMFELEPYRYIRMLDGVELDTFITKDNYKDNMNILYEAFNHRVKVKKKSLTD